jgi:hypothetical protein
MLGELLLTCWYEEEAQRDWVVCWRRDLDARSYGLVDAAAAVMRKGVYSAG